MKLIVALFPLSIFLLGSHAAAAATAEGRDGEEHHHHHRHASRPMSREEALIARMLHERKNDMRSMVDHGQEYSFNVHPKTYPQGGYTGLSKQMDHHLHHYHHHRDLLMDELPLAGTPKIAERRMQEEKMTKAAKSAKAKAAKDKKDEHTRRGGDNADMAEKAAKAEKAARAASAAKEAKAAKDAQERTRKMQGEKGEKSAKAEKEAKSSSQGPKERTRRRTMQEEQRISANKDSAQGAMLRARFF
jgi:hypothetical protein